VALLDEPYTISPARTGDAIISKLVLTGWSATIQTWSDEGRLYWSISTGNVLGCYRHPDKGSGDRVCYGTISNDLVTLAQDNSSGISGTARVVHTDATAATGEIIVSYANEPDLEAVLHSSTSFLSSSQWAGQTRFEEAFRSGKRELDRWLPAKIGNVGTLKDSHEFDLSVVSKPRQLAEVHANLTAWKVLQRMASLDSEEQAIADRFFREAKRIYGDVRLDVDHEQDGTVDAAAHGGFITLVRA
jgi:hypothetical protein